MDIVLRLKLTILNIVNAILKDPVNTFLATAAIFVFSVLAFSCLYMFLYRYHQISVVRHNGKNIVGSVIPIPAFHISDSLRSRFEIRAKNDLLLKKFVGESTNVSWQSFGSVPKSMPDEEGHFKDLRDTITLGTSSVELVETIFPKYSLLKYKVELYRDNSFTTIFPLTVLLGYLKAPSIVALNQRIINNRLNPQEQALYQALVESAPNIKSSVFENKGGKLFWLSEKLKQESSNLEKNLEDKPHFREVFYGELLSLLAPPSSIISFEFDSLPLSLEYMDFLHLSSTLGTSNTSSEIIPITIDVRLLVWIQMMTSYFILALNVAALIKLLKIG